MIALSQPVAIVTGASSGIGAASARACATAGMAVAVAARREDRLTAVANEVTAAGGRALAVAADVTEEAAMRALVSRTLAAFGRVDVLICSAGIGYHASLEDTPPDIMRRLFEVNTLGTLNAIRAVAPYFETQHAGHVVVIGSIVARRGLPGYAGYGASKCAQAGLAEALRAEWRGSGLFVSTVFPVSTVTEFREAMSRNFGMRVEGLGPSQSADAVAAAVVRALRTRAPEVYTLTRARWLAWLNVLAPGWADRFAARYARRRATFPAGRDDGTENAP